MSSPTMNGGDGENSYTRNSSYQARVREGMAFVANGIAKNFDIVDLMSTSDSKIIKILDCGCSVGPNTFDAMKTIVELIKLKYKYSYGEYFEQQPLEFQVFFNDHFSNDFNSLFNNIPSDRDYFVAGVPGSFHGPLFPKESLHFIYSSFSLHWLSSVPNELVDKDSLAYNKGRIYYVNAPKQVLEAYSTQFVKDINSFLSHRAQELVRGGLIALFVPCTLEDDPRFRCDLLAWNVVLEAGLLDMAKEGLISESMIDSFNLPMYFPTQKELKAVMEKNGFLSIVTMQPLLLQNKNKIFDSQSAVRGARAVFEGIISNHFGNNIMDRLFDIINKKIKSDVESYETLVVFVLLKHKTA